LTETKLSSLIVISTPPGTGIGFLPMRDIVSSYQI
jgi:hypothetical protein